MSFLTAEWRAQYKVKSFKIAVDFGLMYSETFEFLTRQEPVSVMLAEGSGILSRR